VLKRADGSSVTLQKADIAQRVTAPSSMPEIYHQTMSRSQLRDMVAFLAALNRPYSDGDTGMNEGGKARALQSVVTEGQSGGHP
jgi:hypothetical protein